MKSRTALALLVFMLAVTETSAQGQTAGSGAQPLTPAPLQTQLEQPPKDATVAELEAKGDLFRLRKAYEQAILYYRAGLQKDAANATLSNKTGIAELQLNDLRAAQKDFERAIKLNPRYADAQNNLGVVHYLRRDYKRAIRHYQRAVDLREDSAPFHSNLGTAWFARRQIDKASAEYARAIELDPDVLIRSSTGGVAAQLSSPEDRAYYQYLLAKMYAKKGDIERCLECLQKAKEGGYNRIKDVYKDEEFVTVRTDPRFAALMERRPQ